MKATYLHPGKQLELIERSPATVNATGAANVDAWASLEGRLFLPAARAGVQPKRFAVTSTPRTHLVATTLMDDHGCHWVISSALADPATRDGRIPVPRKHLDALYRLDSAGAALDFVVIAHELPGSWRPGEPLPRLVPPPERVRRADHVVLEIGHRLLAAAVLTLKVGAVAAAAPIAAAAALAALDPVILGGVVTDDPNLTAWAVIAAWAWGDE